MTSVAIDEEIGSSNRSANRAILSSYIGTAIEQYDFLLYTSAAALVFGSVFFSELPSTAAAVAAYGTLAAGYVARPLGGIIFGHFGDRHGRKRVLVLTMLVMGLVSTLIGVIPSSHRIGWWAAIILVALRACQGIALGGEWGGAALMAVEHSSKERRGWSAALMIAGAPTGAVLGTLMMALVAALPNHQFLAWGWRIPFLLSAVLLVVGLWVRMSVTESPVFLAALEQETQELRRPPILEILRHPRNLILVTFAGAAGFGLQIMLASFGITYAVSSGTARQPVLFAFAGASALSVGFVILAGRISDRVGRRPVMSVGLVGFIVSLPVIFSLFGSGHALGVFAAFTIGLFWHSQMYGPLAAFLSEQFGTTSRYTGAGVGYQLAAVLGAGFTPGILASLHAADGLRPVMGFLAAMAVVSFVAIWMTREAKDVDLTDIA